MTRDIFETLKCYVWIIGIIVFIVSTKLSTTSYGKQADSQPIIQKTSDESVDVNTPLTKPEQILPSRDWPWNNIVGGGNWLYTWPHGLLPDTIPGFEVKSTPVDNSVNNKGKTKSNWAKPVVYGTKNNKSVYIWCKRDYGENQLGGWVPMLRGAHFEQTDFHNLKTGFGIPDDHAEKIDLGDGTYKVVYPPKFNGECCMTFRMSDIVFDLFTQDSNEADAKKRLLNVAEAIYQMNKSKLAEKENDSTKIDKKSISVESLSPEKVNAQIESLRKFIIPPKGVSKSDVDAVFGVPEEIKELPKGGKGSPTDYPMNIYQLLTPKENQEFRAFLYVTYEDEKAKYIGINHICVSKGHITYLQGSPQQIKQQQMIERENAQVLEDLIEIQKKYENKLNDASWNK